MKRPPDNVFASDLTIPPATLIVLILWQRDTQDSMVNLVSWKMCPALPSAKLDPLWIFDSLICAADISFTISAKQEKKCMTVTSKNRKDVCPIETNLVIKLLGTTDNLHRTTWYTTSVGLQILDSYYGQSNADEEDFQKTYMHIRINVLMTSKSIHCTVREG